MDALGDKLPPFLLQLWSSLLELLGLIGPLVLGEARLLCLLGDSATVAAAGSALVSDDFPTFGRLRGDGPSA